MPFFRAILCSMALSLETEFSMHDLTTFCHYIAYFPDGFPPSELLNKSISVSLLN